MTENIAGGNSLSFFFSFYTDSRLPRRGISVKYPHLPGTWISVTDPLLPDQRFALSLTRSWRESDFFFILKPTRACREGVCLSGTRACREPENRFDTKVRIRQARNTPCVLKSQPEKIVRSRSEQASLNAHLNATKFSNGSVLRKQSEAGQNRQAWTHTWTLLSPLRITVQIIVSANYISQSFRLSSNLHESTNFHLSMLQTL